MGDYKPEGLPSEPVIYHCTLKYGTLGWDKKYDNPIPRASCFTYANGNFYEYFGGAVTLLHPQDMKPVSSILLEELLMGLTWDGSGFWSTFEHSLQYRGKNLSTVDQNYFVDAGLLRGLTLKKDYFWSYDSDRNLVLKISPQGTIVGSYRPIFTNTGDWITVHDMEVGWDGQLWISSTSGEIYTLDIE